MNAHSDDALRKQFSELRERDHAAAPPFERVLPHAPTRKPRGAPRLAWLTVAAASAVVVGFYFLSRVPVEPPGAEMIALPAWPAGTAFLLADTGGSSSRLTWSSSPTAGLGQSTFTRLRENR